MSKTKAVLIVLAGVFVLLLIVYLFSANKGHRGQLSAPPTNTVNLASPTPLLPETYSAPTATPVTKNELMLKKIMTSTISFPALFFTYPWGDFAVDSSAGKMWRGVVVSDTNWYAIAVPEAVQWCEEIVVSAPDVVPHMAVVHPEVPTVVRKIHFVRGDIIRWGCVINGRAVWSSAAGGDGWGCVCEKGECVVNIRAGSANVAHLLVSPTCWRIDGSYIVRLEDGRESERIETPLKGNWLAFGDFICSGGQFPDWEVCIDWDGNEISNPRFPSQGVVSISLPESSEH